MFERITLLICALAGSIDVASAQQPQPPNASRAGRRPLLTVAEEIALARTAAPASISGKSRVMVLTDAGYRVADLGTSAVTCVVNRSWNKSVEPHCYDAEAAATVMPMELRRNYLRHLGKSEAEIDTDLAAGLKSGKYRLPKRPAMTYMMSSAQVLYDDTGKYVGNWRPHLMLYYPNLTNDMLALPDKPELRVGMVAGSGGAESSLIIIMPTFADAPPKSP
ncbi:MAG TPA: hypothetical protein VM939_07765 [Gemmatimonadaceae bacterium]|nr:hypothetical protein [Gemmatimonadaceae bacterium]